MLPAKSGVGFSSDHNIKERIRPVGEVTNNDNNVKVTQAERCVRLNRRCVGNVLKKLVSRHDKSDTLRIFICSWIGVKHFCFSWLLNICSPNPRHCRSRRNLDPYLLYKAGHCSHQLLIELQYDPFSWLRLPVAELL